MDRDQTTLAGSGRCDHTDHQGVRETTGAAGHSKVARHGPNGAKRKLVCALVAGCKTWDELVEATGLTRKQVIQNMHYLRTRGEARLVWEFTPREARKGVPAWIQVVRDAIEEART